MRYLPIILFLVVACTPTLFKHPDQTRNFEGDQYRCMEDLANEAQALQMDPNLWIFSNINECLEKKYGWIEVKNKSDKDYIE